MIKVKAEQSRLLQIPIRANRTMSYWHVAYSYSIAKTRSKLAKRSLY